MELNEGLLEMEVGLLARGLSSRQPQSMRTYFPLAVSLLQPSSLLRPLFSVFLEFRPLSALLRPPFSVFLEFRPLSALLRLLSASSLELLFLVPPFLWLL